MYLAQTARVHKPNRLAVSSIGHVRARNIGNIAYFRSLSLYVCRRDVTAIRLFLSFAWSTKRHGAQRPHPGNAPAIGTSHQRNY
jgi:hypothetical protein